MISTINLILVTTIMLIVTIVDGAQIISFNITSPVENGTSAAILDCHFIYDPSEENLVMKWYHNDNPRPVYQWIIALRKRSYSDEIRRHIDPDFKINNPQSEHRAIRLIAPTTRLSGNYKCTVSSIQSSDSASAKLIVYAPAKSFTFKAHNESTVTCKATGLYPSPVIDLYRLIDSMEDAEDDHSGSINVNHYHHLSVSSALANKSASSKIKITKEGYTVITGEQGKYSIESTGSIDENDHKNSIDHHNDQPTISYQCHLFIPDTNYTLTKTLTLTKGWNQRLKVNGKSSSVPIRGYNLLMVITTLVTTYIKLTTIC